MKDIITQIDKNGNIAVDDTILVKGYESKAGSHILEGFVPLFSADSVERLEKAGYKIAGKTDVGEFGLDLLGEFSYYGENDDKLSSACANAISEKKVKAGLCVDLNGTPRRAAAVSGNTFIKPTYGTVSRYGVIPCACSGEQIGVLAEDAKTVAEILSVIAGHDDKDGTSLPQEKYEYKTDIAVDGMRVLVISNLYDLADSDVKAKLDSVVNALTKSGCKVDKKAFDLVNVAKTAWQILMSAETCNNISRYDGVKFGYRTQEYNDIDELYVKSRTEGFNFLTKATLIYGSDVLSKGRYDDCYDKALRTRRVIVDALKALFADYDMILCPACSKTAYAPYKIEDAFDKVYAESVFTALASISGYPAIVTNGVQFVSAPFEESKLFSVADMLEKEGL